MGNLLRGAPIAAAICKETALEAAALKEQGIIPTLGILRVGNRPADIAYEQSAIRCCQKVGVAVKLYPFPEVISQETLLHTICCINTDCSIHGCLVFQPFPPQIDVTSVRQTLSSEKDVDGFTGNSLPSALGMTSVGFPPCTPKACMALLDYYEIELYGKQVAVVGCSLVVGIPLCMMLIRRGATVTACHIGTKDVPAICRASEIILVAAGHVGLVTREFVSEGQIIIDIGINLGPHGNLCGDVDFEQVSPLADAISPVPGGVGSITTAILASHVVQAAKRGEAFTSGGEKGGKCNE